MATLVDVYGAVNANVYILVADALTFLTDEVLDNAEFLSATTARREAALLQATRDIDSELWAGSKYFYTQGLKFPRTAPGLSYPWQAAGFGAEPDANFFSFIEQDQYLKLQKLRVRQACALQAQWLLRNAGRNVEREHQMSGVSSASMSRAGISESQSYTGAGGMKLFSDVFDMLAVYASSPRLVRGSSNIAEYNE